MKFPSLLPGWLSLSYSGLGARWEKMKSFFIQFAYVLLIVLFVILFSSLASPIPEML